MSELHKTTGTLVAITQTELKGPKGFPMAKLALRTDKNEKGYDSLEVYSIKGDKCEEVHKQGLRSGQRVTATWVVDGNEWKDSYFEGVKLIGVKVEAGSVQQQAPQSAPYSDNELDSDSVPF